MDFCGFLWIPTLRAHYILARHNRVLVCITFCCLPVDRAPAMAPKYDLAEWNTWPPVDRSHEPSHGILLSALTEAPALWPDDFTRSLAVLHLQEPVWCYEINAEPCEFNWGNCTRPCALRCNLDGIHSGAHQGMQCVCRTCYRLSNGYDDTGLVFWDAPTPANDVTLQPLPADLQHGEQLRVLFMSGSSCQGEVVMRNSRNKTYGLKLQVGLFGRAPFSDDPVDPPSNRDPRVYREPDSP
jgi:hypothetical protein